MSSSLGTIINEHRNVLNFVGGDQVNYQYNYQAYPPAPEVPNRHPVNNAPVDLLSVHFTGRSEELEFIEKALSTIHSGVPSRCTVHGMPGLGKTHLVLRYAKLSFDQNKYSFVMWISATSVDKINQGISGILDLIGHRDRYLQDQTAKLTTARLWLEQSTDAACDWLLVFDNVHRDTLGFLRSHLPLGNERGNILFTTRTKDVAEALANAGGERHPVLGLQPLELRDSVKLLLEDAGIDVDVVTPYMLSQAEDLVKRVGRLPLAVVHTASFMKQTHTTIDNMLELYKNERKIEVIRWENDLTPYEARSVAAVFENQLNELNQQSRDIGNLLKLLSFLDPEYIPVAMIVDGAKESLKNRQGGQVLSQPKCTIVQKFKEWRVRTKGHTKGQTSANVTEPSHRSPKFDSLITLILSPIEFQSAIQKLQSLSLVEHQSRNGTSSLWIHDLVQFMVREVTKQEGTYDEWLQSSWSIVYRVLLLIKDPRLPRWWPDCEVLILHLQSLRRSWDDVRDMNFEVNEANRKVAEYLDGRGRYDEAEVLYNQVIEWSRNQLGFDHLDTLTAMNDLGLVYHSQGRHNEAEELYKKTIDVMEKRLGPDHRKTLTSMNNLALVYSSQGRCNEAEVLLMKTLAIKEKRLGADHKDTLVSMHNLALAYSLQERYDESESLHRRTLDGCMKRLGADNPHTLMSMTCLADVYASQGRYGEAETLHKKSIEGTEKQLGADHPDTLASISCLAKVYSLQGRYNEAEALHKRTLEGRMKCLGEDHPDTLSSMDYLADTYSSQGRHDEAKVLRERCQRE